MPRSKRGATWMAILDMDVDRGQTPEVARANFATGVPGPGSTHQGVHRACLEGPGIVALIPEPTPCGDGSVGRSRDQARLDGPLRIDNTNALVT